VPRPPFLKFLEHIHVDTHVRIEILYRVISSWEMPLPTQHTTNTRGRTSMLSAGFKPAIPEFDRPQTYTFDRTATATGARTCYGNTITPNRAQLSIVCPAHIFERFELHRVSQKSQCTCAKSVIHCAGSGKLTSGGVRGLCKMSVEVTSKTRDSQYCTFTVPPTLTYILLATARESLRSPCIWDSCEINGTQ